jgi:hypothetical protein
MSDNNIYKTIQPTKKEAEDERSAVKQGFA